MRKFLAWLSLRFPVQLVVTQREWDALDGALRVHKAILDDLGYKVAALEKDLKQLKAMNGFAQSPLGPVRLER